MRFPSPMWFDGEVVQGKEPYAFTARMPMNRPGRHYCEYPGIGAIRCTEPPTRCLEWYMPGPTRTAGAELHQFAVCADHAPFWLGAIGKAMYPND